MELKFNNDDMIREENTSPLKLYDDDNKMTYNCGTRLFYLGRDTQKCAFVINDKSVSGIHATFSYSDKNWFVEDMCSTNGTYKNGVRLEKNKMTKLSIGDEIVFGTKKLYVEKKVKPEKASVHEIYNDEKARQQMELALKEIVENNGNFNEVIVKKLIYGFCFAPLYVGGAFEDNDVDNFKICSISLGGKNFVPVFTSESEAIKNNNKFDVALIKTEKLIAILLNMDEDIVLNLYSDTRAVISKQLFKEIIFPQFLRIFKTKGYLEQCHRISDPFGAQICEYNLEFDDNERKNKYVAILYYLTKNNVWVPCRTDCSSADMEKLVNAKKGDVFSFEALKLKPDVLKDKKENYFFPVFSDKEQAPQEYRDNFSWISIPFIQCCQWVKAHSQTNEIIINAFTEHLLLDEEILSIMSNNYGSGSDKSNDTDAGKPLSIMPDLKCEFLNSIGYPTFNDTILKNNWETSNVDKTVSVPLGIKEDGSLCYFDMKIHKDGFPITNG